MEKQIITALIVTCLSCQGIDKGSQFLSTTEINEILSSTYFQHLNSESNIHIEYKEHLNDSTWHIEIFTCQNLAYQENGICNVFQYEGRNVFVYDSTCQKDIEKQLLFKEGDKDWRWIPDSGDWILLLVKRRNGYLTFYEMGFPKHTGPDFNKQENENLLEELDML